MSDIQDLKRAMPALRDYIERHGDHTADLDGSGRGGHPIHGSSTGTNLAVDDDVWYCHSQGCECGGDILAWYAYDKGHVSSCTEASQLGSQPAAFHATITEAAEEYGVELEGGPDPQKYAERERLAEVYDAACDFYEENLTDEHRAWLRERYGLSDAIIEEARIGYAPDDWEALTDHLKSEGFDRSRLAEAALAVEGKHGWRDWTADRIVFPYIESGDVRHFIGRAYPDFDPNSGGPGKYMKMRSPNNYDNISEEVYEPMFGIDTLRGLSDGETVIVTEGITDTLALHDAGWPAVAPVTTTFSDRAMREAARELRGYDVVVVMDEDPETDAGINGAVRTAKALADRNVRGVSVARIPAAEGEAVDMADYLRDGGNVWDILDGEVNAYAAAYRWGDGDVVDLYRYGCEQIDWPPWRVATWTDEDGEEHEDGVEDLVGGCRTLADAHRKFERHQTELDGTTRQEFHAHVVHEAMSANGDWFVVDRGDSDALHYYDDEDATVYEVEGGGRGAATAEFRGLIQERFAIHMGTWSRNLLGSIIDRAKRHAPTKPLYLFGAYNEDSPALYINAYDDRYYAVTGDGVEERRNGEDVFFGTPHDGEAYNYLPESERVDLPSSVPGERPLFAGGGDAVMRLIPNRVNFDEDANLPPMDQRNQLYLHLHTLPFISMLNSRPIMGWVGEKGSGKTVVQRSIGKWLFGPDFTESPMPDSADDFSTKLARKPLAFIDNYDDGEPWANDLLASVTTGSSIERRELFTTAGLAQYRADCWVSVTSREPPFRRDDVADRTLVFRVERVDTGGDEFIPEGVYYRQIDRYRDTLWSEYLDNLSDVLAELEATDLDTISTTHRMADWAVLAKVIGKALDVDGVEDLLEAMQYEQAYFALEEDPVALTVERWISDDADDAGTWRRAGEMLDRLEEKNEEYNAPPLDVGSPGGLGKKLSSGLRSNYAELYDLEIRKQGRSNEYRFGDGEDQTTGTGLGRY